MGSAPAIPAAALRDPVILIATGFGAGLLRPGPGTWGTLVGLPLAWLLAQLPLAMASMLLLTLAVLGIGICGAAGRRLGVSDHGGIVYDEIIGLCVTLLLFPFDWVTVLIGFLAFRLFDIFKPWPASWADRELHGGLGVMVDDLIAGLYAALLTFGVREVLMRLDLLPAL